MACITFYSLVLKVMCIKNNVMILTLSLGVFTVYVKQEKKMRAYCKVH